MPNSDKIPLQLIMLVLDMSTLVEVASHSEARFTPTAF